MDNQFKLPKFKSVPQEAIELSIEQELKNIARLYQMGQNIVIYLMVEEE